MGIEIKFFLAAILVATIRIVGVYLSPGRVETKIRSMGGKFISKEVFPKDRGFLANLTDRRYKVRYVYVDKHEHEALVKIGIFKGVYFLKDEVVQ